MGVNGKCTIGDGCDPVQYPDTAPRATSRMTPADVSALDQLAELERDEDRHGLQGGRHRRPDRPDRLRPAHPSFQTNQSQFRWINHTYSHPVPRLRPGLLGVAVGVRADLHWVDQLGTRSTIQNEIITIHFARNRRLSVNAVELVTGEHPG